MTWHLFPLFSPPFLLTALSHQLQSVFCAPKPSTASHHSDNVSSSISIFGHCSVHSYGSKCFTSQHHSLPPSISVSDHPSQSILTAPAKRPFSGPQQLGLIQQTTPTDSANWPMAEQVEQQEICIKAATFPS